MFSDSACRCILPKVIFGVLQEELRTQPPGPLTVTRSDPAPFAFLHYIPPPALHLHDPPFRWLHPLDGASIGHLRSTSGEGAPEADGVEISFEGTEAMELLGHGLPSPPTARAGRLMVLLLGLVLQTKYSYRSLLVAPWLRGFAFTPAF